MDNVAGEGEGVDWKNTSLQSFQCLQRQLTEGRKSEDDTSCYQVWLNTAQHLKRRIWENRNLVSVPEKNL